MEPEQLAALDRAMAAAESSLREGELQAAESRYRDALREGWLLLGTLARVEGRLEEALRDFERASMSAFENAMAQKALALVHLQIGESGPALAILTRLAAKDRQDLETRRLLAIALGAAGRPDEAARELEEARAAAPGDVEVAFALAAAYLGAKRNEDAARVFAEIVRERPLPQTRVLIGVTYRDFGEFESARAALHDALAQDPRVRRAHYTLGNLTVAEKGRAGLEEAIADFRAELELAPEDRLANLELGMALVETQRPEEALPALEVAARDAAPDARTLYYLGRARLGVGRPAEAAASLKEALDLVERGDGPEDLLRVIHNQLGQALGRLGEGEEARAHFKEAERLSAEGTETSREQLARQMAGVSEPRREASAGLSVIETSTLAGISASERRDLAARTSAALARTYLNLGVMHAQKERFAAAAEQFERAAAVDPEFPRVQSSLGIAYFNARQFDKATGPLARALAAEPADAGIRRMLAMAWLNTRQYAKAAELLADDPELDANPQLRFAYGLALAKSDQGERAEEVFSRLLRLHGDQAELHVLLGKAYAQMGDFDSAIASFDEALAKQPDVAEAHGALGVIYLKQGRMGEAEAELRQELTVSPGDVQTRQNLAYVLDSEQRPSEALPLLREILTIKPDFADARYLLGKILLAQGATDEAVEHLEAAMRVAPEDANTHYQLGRAYTKLGRAEEAEQQFETFRQIKSRR